MSQVPQLTLKLHISAPDWHRLNDSSSAISFLQHFACLSRSCHSFLMPLVISILMLVPGNVSRSVYEVLPAGDALPLAGVVEALPVRAGVLAGVRQPVHGSGRGGGLCQLEMHIKHVEFTNQMDSLPLRSLWNRYFWKSAILDLFICILYNISSIYI